MPKSSLLRRTPARRRKVGSTFKVTRAQENVGRRAALALLLASPGGISVETIYRWLDSPGTKWSAEMSYDADTEALTNFHLWVKIPSETPSDTASEHIGEILRQGNKLSPLGLIVYGP